MGTQKLKAVVSVFAIVTIGTATWYVWTPDAPGVTEAHYADAGLVAPNRIATCDVRLSTGCADDEDAGSRYLRLRFPIYLEANGNRRDAVFPPRTPLGLELGRRCVEFLDFSACALALCSTDQAFCDSAWGSTKPWQRVTQPCRRRNSAKGFATCLRSGIDFGEWNAFPAVEASGACEETACVVFAGEES